MNLSWKLVRLPLIDLWRRKEGNGREGREKKMNLLNKSGKII